MLALWLTTFAEVVDTTRAIVDVAIEDGEAIGSKWLSKAIETKLEAERAEIIESVPGLGRITSAGLIATMPAHIGR